MLPVNLYSVRNIGLYAHPTRKTKLQFNTNQRFKHSDEFVIPHQNTEYNTIHKENTHPNIIPQTSTFHDLSVSLLSGIIIERHYNIL